jgi:long-subunit fatty acid transport protein
MTRNFKALGLALVAAFAMSAVVASAASAAEFHAEKAPVTLTGSQHAGEDVFTTDAGTVSCEEATYTGSQATVTALTASATPKYSGCHATFGLNTTVDVNECKYIFNANTGKVDISCPAGKVIAVTAPGCEITVGSQTGLSSATFTNVGAGTTREITIDVALSGIKYEEHNKGFFPTCKANTVAKSNGTYKGSALVTGENAEKVHIGIWWL